MPAVDLSYVDPNTGSEFNGYLADSKVKVFMERFSGPGSLTVRLHVPVEVRESKTDDSLEFLRKHQFTEK